MLYLSVAHCRRRSTDSSTAFTAHAQPAAHAAYLVDPAVSTRSFHGALQAQRRTLLLSSNVVVI